jgi:hypothetical protein
MAHYEQYDAFEEICREGLAYLSRFTGGLEPEDQSTPFASTNSTPTIMEGDQDAGTTDDETSSSSSEDGAESVASSFMDEEEYLTITDPFTALFWELYRLAPRINRNELEEILFLIPLFLPQEIVLSHFLVRVKCNCPRTGQETSRCLRCHKNICPVSTLSPSAWLGSALVVNSLSIVSEELFSDLLLLSGTISDSWVGF